MVTTPTTAAPTSEAATVEPRRAAVQRLRAQGWSLRRIAEQLGISLGTAHADAAAGVQTGVQRVQPERPAEHLPSTPHGAAPEVRSDNTVVSGTGASAAAAAAAAPRDAHDCVYDPDGYCLHVDGAGCASRCPEDTAAATTGAEDFAIALFARYDRPGVAQRTVSVDDLVDLLTTFDELADKRQARCWSPTKYADGAASRANAGVEAVSCLVFDCDRVEPDWARLEGCWYVAHTTYQHTPEHPRWRLVLPLAAQVPATEWRDVWQRARAALCPEADPSCKDPSRQYYLPSHPHGRTPETVHHAGPLLDVRMLPPLPKEPRRRVPRGKAHQVTDDHRRGEAYLRKVVDNLARMAPDSGRNKALNAAAWKLGQWVAAGALDQGAVEDALYAAAERNGLVTDDGQRQCWATTRSGLGAGLQQPIDLDAYRRTLRR